MTAKTALRTISAWPVPASMVCLSLAIPLFATPLDSAKSQPVHALKAP